MSALAWWVEYVIYILMVFAMLAVVVAHLMRQK
jgi:hypothetical protein